MNYDPKEAAETQDVSTTAEGTYVAEETDAPKTEDGKGKE